MKFRSRRSEMDIWPIMADLFSGLMLAMLVLLLVESGELTETKASLAKALADSEAARTRAQTCNTGLTQAQQQVKKTEVKLEECSGPVRGLQEEGSNGWCAVRTASPAVPPKRCSAG